MVGYFEQSTDDVETLYAGGAGSNWESEHLQLSPGRLGSWISVVSLPDLSIHWYRLAAAMRTRECHRHDAVFFTFLLHADGVPRWRGREVHRNQALVYLPGQEQDYALPPNMHSLGLLIGKRLIGDMGWNIRPESVLRTDAVGLDALAACCAQATSQVRQGGVSNPEEALLIQERLAMRLGDVLAPWLGGPGDGVDRGLSPSRAHRVIRGAERHMAQWDQDDKLDVARLAEGVGVSPRTLYRAFREYFGMGPYEYHLLLKLRDFRRGIRHREPGPGLVTSVAGDVGFQHLGRFSETYRRHFGELPRDTLRRWSQSDFGTI